MPSERQSPCPGARQPAGRSQDSCGRQRHWCFARLAWTHCVQKGSANRWIAAAASTATKWHAAFRATANPRYRSDRGRCLRARFSANWSSSARPDKRIHRQFRRSAAIRKKNGPFWLKERPTRRKNTHLLPSGQMPTRGFTAVLSVFKGTPPKEALGIFGSFATQLPALQV